MKHFRLFLILLLGVLALGQTFLVPKEDARRISVLFFGAPTSHSAAHDPITRYRVLKKHLGIHGIDLTYTEDPAEAFNAENLAHHDALLMYGNWEQNGKMPEDQEKALLEYVKQGGGFLPIHCASACYGASPNFVKLVGARFKSHGGEVFAPKNTEVKHPITEDYTPVEAWDETYVHSDHNDDRVVLQMREDEPWTWIREEGKGRIFYTASGHDHRVWDKSEFHELLRRAILWSVGDDSQAKLEALDLPELEFGKAQLPGYRKRETIEEYQLPLSPSDSMKHAQVPPGFELALFASEPDIVNPIAINWDGQGRAYVIETIDYPNNLQAKNIGHDRITICEDTDGDGAADKFTRFAENLSIPTSLVFTNHGVVCTNGNELLYLRDTDGDHQADVRKTLFKGFNMGDTHAGVSNLRHGPDGWIYGTVGYSGFNGKVGNEDHQFSTGLFRFKIDQSVPDAKPGEDGTLQHLAKLEFVQNTTNNTWGLGFTRDLDIFTSTANGNPSLYLTFPKAIYDKADLKQPRMPRADSKPLFFPASTDIRQVENHDGYTSAAGHSFYDAYRFPKFYLENNVAFVCAPTGKLVGQFHVTANGAGFQSRQLPNNIYNSADAWSAPVAAEVGPDGALWICDWYSIIIQHNPTPSVQSAGYQAERGKGNAYITPLRDKEHGRIYRIYPKGSVGESEDWINLTGWGLLGFFSANHPRIQWEGFHQRFISYAASILSHEKGGDVGRNQLMGDLRNLKVYLKSGKEPNQVWVFRTLHAIGQLDLESIIDSLQSENSALRRLALRSAPLDGTLERLFIKDGEITESDPRTLMELLLAFSRVAPTEGIVKALAQLQVPSDDIALTDALTVVRRTHGDAIILNQASSWSPPDAVKKAPNLFLDPSLDELTGWSPKLYGPGNRETKFSHSKTEGRNGSPCLKIESETPADCGWGFTMKVNPNTRYRLGGWIKTVDLNAQRGPGALFNVHGLAQSKGVVKNTDWTEVSVEFTTGRDQREVLVHCLFGGYGSATGVALYDDLYLRELEGGESRDQLVELTQHVAKTASPQRRNALLAALKKQDSPGSKHLSKLLGEVAKEPAPIRKHKPDAAVHRRGKAVYDLTCIACHGPDGSGVPGTFPPLDGAEWVTGDLSTLTKIVLHGLQGPIKIKGEPYNNVMPPLGSTLSDQQISDVATYVRQNWSNDASPVTPAEVATIRSETVDRKSMYRAGDLSGN